MGKLTAERLDRLPPYAFVEVRKRIREAKARGIDVISLAIGDPDRPTPPHVIEALNRAARDPANHTYPTDEDKGMLAFREAVARWYAARFGVSVDPETEVIALIGSKEGNHHVALATLDPGDVAIIPDPGYPAYAASALFAGAEVVRVPLSTSDGFLLDFEAIPADILPRTKLIWLSYPNNPTTAIAPLDFYERAVAFAQQHGIVLVSDNPYSEIAYDGLRTHSILEVEGSKDVAIEFNSLSKPYNMTGWRIGMALGSPALVRAVATLKENTDSGIFNAVQYAGIAALDGPQDVISDNIAVYQRRRDLVVETLRSLGFELEPPKATFYVWAPIPGGQGSLEWVSRLLELTGVAVTPGIGFGSRGEGFIRISLSVPDHRLDEAIERIRGARAQLLPAVAARAG